jgi:hypothetical protein
MSSLTIRWQSAELPEHGGEMGHGLCVYAQLTRNNPLRSRPLLKRAFERETFRTRKSCLAIGDSRMLEILDKPFKGEL